MRIEVGLFGNEKSFKYYDLRFELRTDMEHPQIVVSACEVEKASPFKTHWNVDDHQFGVEGESFSEAMDRLFNEIYARAKVTTKSK